MSSWLCRMLACRQYKWRLILFHNLSDLRNLRGFIRLWLNRFGIVTAARFG